MRQVEVNGLTLLIGIIFLVKFTGGTSLGRRDGSTPNMPIPYRDRKFIWWPHPSGRGVVPAFLEGGPKAQWEKKDSIFMNYYSKNNPNPIRIYEDVNLIRQCGFKPEDNTVILAHGFSGSAENAICTGPASEFLKLDQNINIVCVDWSELAAAPWYDTASANTMIVGGRISEFTQFLYNNKFSSPERTILVGHSLGAHCCAVAGFLLGGQPGTLHALDPAGPLYYGAAESSRVDSSDAQYVQVSHTNAGMLGYPYECGDLDVFFGGGSSQAGCGWDLVGTCAHSRAVTYYTESIANDKAFHSHECSSLDAATTGDCQMTGSEGILPVYVGHHTPAEHKGIYYCPTNEYSPYSMS